jgi:hypothetical protein
MAFRQNAGLRVDRRVSAVATNLEQLLQLIFPKRKTRKFKSLRVF